MLGTCPYCKVKLREPPFGERNTNEVMLVLKYRKIIENKLDLKSLEELGYCELCNATIDDIKVQNIS